jgi:glyoxylase I family protein
MPQVTGIDHIYISVRDLARSEAFYDRVMSVLGFRKAAFAIDSDPHVHYFNRHFSYVLRPAKASSPHDPYAAGLHHLCFRVEEAADVAETARKLRTAGIDASDARVYPEYAPDYHATFFTDPDGVRLEVTNYRAERRQRHEDWDKT